MKQYGSDSDLIHFKSKEGHGAEVIKTPCGNGKDPLDPAQCEILSIRPYPEAMLQCSIDNDCVSWEIRDHSLHYL